MKNNVARYQLGQRISKFRKC